MSIQDSQIGYVVGSFSEQLEAAAPAVRKRFTLITFHKPVPARVKGEYTKTTSAVHHGATTGVLDRENGRVYPFPDRAAAAEALTQLAPDVAPDAIPYRWEPHYSSEYTEEP